MLRPTAVEVKSLENYKLLITFNNGEQRIFDVKPYIKGDWYSELKDLEYFTTVHVSGLSVEWKHGQDICPDDLYTNSIEM